MVPALSPIGEYMSIPLKDFRGGLTEEMHALLDAEAEVTGREKQEIVRGIIQVWADKQIEVYRVQTKKFAVAGLDGILTERRGMPEKP